MPIRCAQLRVLVVAVRRVQELDAGRTHHVDAAHDVVRGDRDVLRARALVELQILVDLRFALGNRRLVERELHLAGAAGDDLAHQRRVVGGDVVADELGHVREAHDALVELDPLVHLAQLDVADDVVDRLEEALGLNARLDGGAAIHDRVARDEAGPERAAVL